jgi:hypothetical protein
MVLLADLRLVSTGLPVQEPDIQASYDQGNQDHRNDQLRAYGHV